MEHIIKAMAGVSVPSEEPIESIRVHIDERSRFRRGEH